MLFSNFPKVPFLLNSHAILLMRFLTLLTIVSRCSGFRIFIRGEQITSTYKYPFSTDEVLHGTDHQNVIKKIYINILNLCSWYAALYIEYVPVQHALGMLPIKSTAATYTERTWRKKSCLLNNLLYNSWKHFKIHSEILFSVWSFISSNFPPNENFKNSSPPLSLSSKIRSPPHKWGGSRYERWHVLA